MVIRKILLTLLGSLFLMTATVSIVDAKPPTVATGGDFTQLNKSGGQAYGATKGAVGAFNWVLAFLPVGMAWYFAGRVKEYLENKEEQGQYQPKATKNFMIVGASLAGILAGFILIGLFGAVFLDKSFSDSWQLIVVDTWKDLFS